MGLELINLQTEFVPDVLADALDNNTPNLAGSVGDVFTLTNRFKIRWFTQVSSSNKIEIIANDNTGATGAGNSITRESGSFLEDGWSVNDRFLWYFINGAYSADDYRDRSQAEWMGEIEWISEDGTKMFFTFIEGIINQSVLEGEVDKGYLMADTTQEVNQLSALTYRFGVIDNEDSDNYDSLVTENLQKYTGVEFGIGSPRSTSFIEMIANGSFSDWVTGDARIRYVENDGYFQVYEVQHTFIVPFYLDNQLNNLLQNQIPDNLVGDASWKYVSRADFQTAISNLSNVKTFSNYNTSGSIGWFGENFNGLPSSYKIESVTFTENLDLKDGLSIGGSTNIDIEVSKNDGANLFNASDRVGITICTIPQNESDYKNTKTDFKHNFIYDRIVLDLQGTTYNSNNGIIKTGEGQIAGQNAKVSFQVSYSEDQRKRILTSSYYLIFVTVADSTIKAGNSDRTALIADCRQYIEDSTVSGLAVQLGNTLTITGQAENETTIVDAKQWVEDLVRHNIGFQISKENNTFLTGVQFDLVAYNEVTGETIEFDSYSIDLSTMQLDSNGIEVIDTQANRGLTDNIESFWNLVNFKVESVSGNIVNFAASVPFRLTNDETTFNSTVPAVFYDSTKPQNNQNFNTAIYSGANGFEIRIRVQVRTIGESETGEALKGLDVFHSPYIEVNDFASDKDGTIDANLIEIKTIELGSGRNLGGGFSLNANTEVETSFEIPNVQVGGIEAFRIIHRIERNDNVSLQKNEISDLYGRLNGGMFSTDIVKEIDNGQIVAKSIVNPLFLDNSGSGYNISARLLLTGEGLLRLFRYISSVNATGSDYRNFVYNGGNSFNLDAVWDFSDGKQYAGTPSGYLRDTTGEYFDGNTKTVTITPNNGQASYDQVKTISLQRIDDFDLDVSMFENLINLSLDNCQNLTGITRNQGNTWSSLSLTNSVSITELDFRDDFFDNTSFVFGGTASNLQRLYFPNAPYTMREFTITKAINMDGFNLDLSNCTLFSTTGQEWLVEGSEMSAFLNPQRVETGAYQFYNCPNITDLILDEVYLTSNALNHRLLIYGNSSLQNVGQPKGITRDVIANDNDLRNVLDLSQLQVGGDGLGRINVKGNAELEGLLVNTNGFLNRLIIDETKIGKSSLGVFDTTSFPWSTTNNNRFTANRCEDLIEVILPNIEGFFSLDFDNCINLVDFDCSDVNINGLFTFDNCSNASGLKLPAPNSTITNFNVDRVPFPAGQRLDLSSYNFTGTFSATSNNFVGLDLPLTAQIRGFSLDQNDMNNEDLDLSNLLATDTVMNININNVSNLNSITITTPVMINWIRAFMVGTNNVSNLTSMNYGGCIGSDGGVIQVQNHPLMTNLQLPAGKGSPFYPVNLQFYGLEALTSIDFGDVHFDNCTDVVFTRNDSFTSSYLDQLLTEINNRLVNANNGLRINISNMINSRTASSDSIVSQLNAKGATVIE